MMVIGDLFRSEENCVVDGGGLFGSKAAVCHRGRSARIDCCLYRSEAELINRRHRWLEMMIMMKKSGVNNVCRYGPLDK
jgi:hypothetical protein